MDDIINNLPRLRLSETNEDEETNEDDDYKNCKKFIPKETIIVKTLNSEKKFDKTNCFNKKYLKMCIESALTKPTKQIRGFKCILAEDKGIKFSTFQIVFQLPSNIFVTYGSFIKMLESPVSKWYAIPIYKKHIGSLTYTMGKNSNEEKIYKLYTKEEIKSRQKIGEQPNEFSFDFIMPDMTSNDFHNRFFSSHKNILYYVFYCLKYKYF